MHYCHVTCYMRACYYDTCNTHMNINVQKNMQANITYIVRTILYNYFILALEPIHNVET